MRMRRVLRPALIRSHMTSKNVLCRERMSDHSLVPRPSRAPALKRVWNLSQDFLALLSQHVRKTGKPIRTQDSKQSCDFNAYWNTARFQFQLPSVYTTYIRSHWNRPIRPKHMTIVLNYVINVIVLIQQCQEILRKIPDPLSGGRT